MIHQLAEAYRERADVRRHEYVGTACCLRSSLKRTVMHRSHLVSVVGEVGGRTRIVERELSADKQRALVMGRRERTAESGTRLTVRHIRIGEEHAACRREAVAQLASLTHVAVLHLHAVDDGRSVADDRVLADDARAYIHRGVTVAHQRAVAQTRRSRNLAVVIYHRIGYLLRIDNLHTIAYGGCLRRRALYLLTHESAYGVLERTVLEVLHHKGCHLTGQAPEENQIAVAHLVEDRDEVALSVRGAVCGFHGTYIGDDTVVANDVIIYKSRYVLYKAVVADGHVSQRGVVDA